MRTLRKTWILIVLAIAIVSTGIYMSSTQKAGSPSRDMAELQSTVRLQVPAKAIRWEIFGTPEDTGGFGVGPTDYMTLVAELEPSDPNWFARQEGTLGRVWIAPESQRPWLSDFFRKLLVKSNADMTDRKDCKALQTEMTTSGRVVKGFVCEHNDKLLVHIMLLAPSL